MCFMGPLIKRVSTCGMGLLMSIAMRSSSNSSNRYSLSCSRTLASGLRSTATGSLKIWAGHLLTGPSFSFTFSTSPPWPPAESCSPPPQLSCTPPPASALPPYPSSPGPLGGGLPSGSCCLTYSAIVEVNPPTPGSSHTWSCKNYT